VSDDDKVRADRLGQAGARQGLTLVKTRRRGPRATCYGTVMLVDARTNMVVAPGPQSSYGMSLEAVEDQSSGAVTA